MLNVKQQWEDKLYRNWLRGSLGLKYLKEGIENVVDSSVKDLHNDMIQAVVIATGVTNLQCGKCTLNNLLPHHAGGRCKQNTRSLCFCNKPGRRRCPNGICSVFCDLIIDSHNLRDPSWNNTDPAFWFSDHWQIAKCFMSPSGIAGTRSAKETDAAGLLSVAINAQYVTNQFSCGQKVLKKMRETRNQTLYSSGFSLQDTEVSDYIDQMIELLLDPKKLVHDVGAQNAVRHLRRLKNINCYISSKDEKEIRKKTLQAIKESEENALENIKRAEINAIDKIETSTSESETISKIKVNQRSSETKLIVLENTVGDIFKRQADTSQLIENMTKRQGHSEEKIESMLKTESRRMKNLNEQKKDMTECLLRTYKRFYTGVDFSPTLPGKEVEVDEVYVPLNMMTVSGEDSQNYYRYYNVRDSFKEVSTNINLEDMSLCMKKVFILAKAGMGKTTFCKHLISEWCKQQSNSIKCLQGIRFLFLVSLKQVNTETSIEQMIKTQLFDAEYHDLVDHVLAKEAKKCLVILDGLDEWIASDDMHKSPIVTTGLPLKEIKSGYATVYTTRPWKYETIKPRDCEVDIKVEIKGIHPEFPTKLAELVFKQLNKLSKNKASAEKFIQDLRHRDLTTLQHIPLLLILLACLWYDKHKFDSSLSGIYSSIIEWLLFNAERRQGKKLSDKALNDQSDCGNVPLCFSDKSRCLKLFNSVLVPLARFSFLTVFTRKIHKSRFVFKTTDFQQLGLDMDCINILLGIGLLSEQAVIGTATAACYRSFSFIHETFHEFFAALYIAIACPIQRVSESVSTAERHLEMSEVYLFLSGMNCEAMACLSKEIGISVDKNENNRNYRRGTSTYTGFVSEMHRMILSCVRESVNSGIPVVPMVLRDICISEETSSLLPYLTGIYVREVVSMYCDSTITDDVRSHLDDICGLELLVCKHSLEALSTVLKRCAHVIKCLVLSKTVLTVDESLSFVQLSNLTMFKVKATRSQICRIYLCSPRLVSVNLDSCLFIEESHCDTYKASSNYFASVERLNIVDCFGLPIGKIPQPMLKFLVFGKASCFYCADLIKTCRNLRIITLVEIDLGKTFLPNLFPSNLIYLETVHLKKVEVSCGNLYFHLEALLKIPSVHIVDLDHVYLTNEKPKTVHDWIKRLQIKTKFGDTTLSRRYITESFEALGAPLATSLSAYLKTESVTCM